MPHARHSLRLSVQGGPGVIRDTVQGGASEASPLNELSAVLSSHRSRVSRAQATSQQDAHAAQAAALAALQAREAAARPAVQRALDEGEGKTDAVPLGGRALPAEEAEAAEDGAALPPMETLTLEELLTPGSARTTVLPPAQTAVYRGALCGILVPLGGEGMEAHGAGEWEARMAKVRGALEDGVERYGRRKVVAGGEMLLKAFQRVGGKLVPGRLAGGRRASTSSMQGSSDEGEDEDEAQEEAEAHTEAFLLQYLSLVFGAPEEDHLRMVREAKICRLAKAAAALRAASDDLPLGYYSRGMWDAREAEGQRYRDAEAARLGDVVAQIDSRLGHKDRRRHRELLGVLHLTIVRAEDLTGKDKTGLSDPYCSLQYGGGQSARTPVKDQELNPVWNERFAFRVKKKECKLRLTVWDRDDLSKDDFLGRLDIRVVHNALYEPRTMRLQLEKRSRRSNISGFLTVELQYVPADGKMRNEDGDVVDVKPDSDMPANQVESFEMLMRQLFLYEHAKRKDTLLSPAASVVLHSYALHHAVSPPSMATRFLRLLADNFAATPVHLEEVLSVMRDLRMFHLSGDEDARLAFTETDLRVEAEAVALIGDKLRKALTTYKSTFAATPGGLPVALNLYDLVVASGISEDAETANKELVKLVDECMLNNYEFCGKSVREQATCGAMVGLVEHVVEEIRDDAIHFAPAFHGRLELLPRSIKIFTSMLMLDLKSLLDSLLTQNEPPANIFDLYFKLREADTMILNFFSDFDPLPITAMFYPFVRDWLYQTSTVLRKWMARALEMDADMKPGLGDVKHSDAVHDTFGSCYQALDFFKNLEWPEDGASIRSDAMRNSTLALELAQAIKLLLVEFVHQTQTRFQAVLADASKASSDLSSSFKKSSGGGEKLAVPVRRPRRNSGIRRKMFGLFKSHKKSGAAEDQELFHISHTLLMPGNNLFAAQSQLDSFVEAIQDALSHPGNEASQAMLDHANATFVLVFSELKANLDEICDKLVDAMEPSISFLITDAVLAMETMEDDDLQELGSDRDGDPVRGLIQYLNEQLQVMADKMYYGVFRVVLRHLWVLLAKHIELVALEGDLTKVQRNGVLLLLALLGDFVHADGEGLPMRFVKTHSDTLCFEIGLTYQSTEDLIELSRTLDADPSNDFGAHHVISVLNGRAQRDKVAKQYCEEYEAALRIQARIKGNMLRRKTSKAASTS